MPDITPSLIGIFGILLLSLSWHEAAHAWVADRLGDPTARSLGRVTLNPLRHLDPVFSFLLPVLMYMAAGVAFGGGKPVPINPANFRNKARDFMLVALAGPGSNLLLVLLGCVLYVALAAAGVFEGPVVKNPFGGADVAYRASFERAAHRLLQGGELASLGEALVVWFVVINLVLAVFNLVPVPPLDGSRVVGWILPRRLQGSWYRLDRVGIVIVLLLFVVFDAWRWVILDVCMPALSLLATTTDRVLDLLPA